MVRLQISTRVPAPIEDVYQHVTAFGENGLLDIEVSHTEYSEDIHQVGEEYEYSEDVRRYPDDPEDIITWRCTFDFPHHRTMRAVDSDWSHRTDIFLADRGFTHWTVQWDTQDTLLRGVIKFIAFRLITNRSLRRRVLDRVREHFEKNFQ